MVLDTSIGIPDDKRDIIFSSFSQAAASTTRKFGGSGLGLAICKQLIEMMDGAIWLENNSDQGTIFHFTPAMDSCWPQIPVPDEDVATRLKPLDILLVDDDSINCMVAHYILEKGGQLVVVANNGLESLEILANQHVDMVLMDVQMPVMDGLTAGAVIHLFAGEAWGRRLLTISLFYHPSFSLVMDTEIVIPRFLANHKEFKQITVDDFSCVVYKTSAEAYKVKLLVTSYLFVIVLNGRKVIHRENDELHIGAGSGFFARKGAYLFSELLECTDEYKTLIFCIDDSCLAGFLKKYPELAGQPAQAEGEDIFRIELTPLLQSYTQSVLPLFVHNSQQNGRLMRLKLEELLLHIVEADGAGRFIHFLRELYSSRKRNLVQLMDEYYTKPLSLEELARLSGRSLSSFKRDFRALFNETPKQWINARRLEQARMLLTSSDLNVSEVCFAVGFENISHFSQLFKKRYGYSPGSIKQREPVCPSVD